MIDSETRMVHWSGIWRALGKSKADVVELIESQPDIAGKVRKVRGGCLKIQGTWLPHEIAEELARRVAWDIRHDLVPLFGPAFPDSCLSPFDLGFGNPVLSAPTNSRRRTRDPAAVQRARNAAKAAQNNKNVKTADQAAGLIVGADVKKEVKGAEGGAEAVEWWQGRAKLSPDLRGAGRGPGVEVEVPQMILAAPVKAERPRTASGGFYGGIRGSVRGSSAPQDAMSFISARYAPYRYPATTSALASYPSTLPSPSRLHPQIPHSQYGSSEQYPYFPPTSHHQHQHQQLPRLSTTFAYPPTAALAPHSATTYHLPPPLPTSTHYPRFEGGAPMSRSVSAPDRSTSWELPSASVDAEGGRLWLGMGMGLGHSVSSVRGEVVPVPVARAGEQSWVSAMGGAQPNAGGGAGSVRLPPLAMMDSLPPRPPRPTLITQSDLLSHAWATNLSHPNYATSDPHRHQHHLTSSGSTSSTSPVAASTSPQSGVSSSSGFFHSAAQGQGQSVEPPVMLTTMMCARNEEMMGQLALAASRVAEGEGEGL